MCTHRKSQRARKRSPNKVKKENEGMTLPESEGTDSDGDILEDGKQTIEDDAPNVTDKHDAAAIHGGIKGVDLPCPFLCTLIRQTKIRKGY